MPKIVTTSELQKHIGKMLQYLSRSSWMIVTNRGKAKVVMLPYFDENDRAVEEYLEDYEIRCNIKKLKRRWQESADSGESDLVI